MNIITAEKSTNSPNGYFSRKVISQIPWAVVKKLTFFLTSFAVSVIVVRSLGKEKYGLFSICKSIAECLFVICGLGLNIALIRFVPEMQHHKEKKGLYQLLKRIAFSQLFAVFIFGVLLALGKPYLNKWFKTDFQSLLWLITFLVGVRIIKNFIHDTFTAIFQVRVISIISIYEGILWLGVTALFVFRYPEINVALIARILPISLFCVVSLFLLLKALQKNTADWEEQGVFSLGKKRFFETCFPYFFNLNVRMLLDLHSEIFFLGLFFSAETVGIYALGCGISVMIISFVPNALKTLLTSGFVEAYTKDKNCLGRLISSVYKALILTVVPISIFGFAFGETIIEVFYGKKMIEAGPIAALFSLVHSLNLISVPLSMALITLERLSVTNPLHVLQGIINLLLDFWLIPRFEMYGAIAAVFCTFLLTIPIRLYVVIKITGGLFFPLGFFLKVLLILVTWATLFSFMKPFMNFFTLPFFAVLYFLCYGVTLRFFRVIKQEDTDELRNLGFSKLNQVLDFLVR